MSCNSCAKAFTLLRKEKGCPNCGFSYCSKCLAHSVFLTKTNAEAKVCIKCKRILDSNETQKGIEPPDAYYKRIGVNKPNSTNVNTSSNSKDQEIHERLQSLKEVNKQSVVQSSEDIQERLNKIKGEPPLASTEEIQDRLAKLKGLPTTSGASNKTYIAAVDLRTEQEQADDLMKQYLEQVQIDKKYTEEFDNVVSDIEGRLALLKGNNVNNISEKDKPENVTETVEDTVKKIIDKYKAEATLEEAEAGLNISTNDELPFCEICNEDATLRCLGCRYLFCKRCFQEHKDDDDGCNRYEPYKKPNNVEI